VSGLQYTRRRLPGTARLRRKTRIPPAPVSSRVAAPRQLIRRLSRRPLLSPEGGLLGWGILHRQIIRPGRLLQSSPAQRPLSTRPVCERAPDGLLLSMCPFSATLGRYSASCPSYRVETPYALTTEPNGDKFPFGPAWSAVILAGSDSRRLRTVVENPVPGCLLGAVAALG
jgi:hypothetical protein